MEGTNTKVLSFEEYSSRNSTETTKTEEVIDDVESTEEVEETEDAEEESAEEVVDDDDDDDSDDDDGDDDISETVAEMMESVKEMMKSEAKAYESDDYDEHTVESYLKENAALIGGVAAKALEEMKEADETYTKEAYEATCNSLKESYAKKLDEACETYKAEGTEIKEPQSEENEPHTNDGAKPLDDTED